MTQIDTSVAETKIVNAVRTIIAKSTPAEKPITAQPAVILINFDGAGQPPQSGMAGLAEVTFPCRILGCHIYAGDQVLAPTVVTATVDLRLGTHGAWSSGTAPLYGSGAMPSITAAAEVDASIVGWVTDLQPGDLIAYRLDSLSGLATWLTVALPVRRLDTRGLGVSGILAGSSGVVSASGNTVVQRGG